MQHDKMQHDKMKHYKMQHDKNKNISMISPSLPIPCCVNKCIPLSNLVNFGRMPLFFTLLGILIFILNLSTCVTQNNSATSKDSLKETKLVADSELRYCIPVHLNTLDPATMGVSEQIDFILNIYEGLMTYTAGSDKPVLGLAEKVEVLDQGLTYRVVLRKNLVWSDGEPITTADVYFSFRHLLTPDRFLESETLHYIHLLEPIKNAIPYQNESLPSLEDISIATLEEYESYFAEVGIEIIDDYEILFHLTNPTPYFMEILAQPNYAPLPKHYVESHPNWGTSSSLVCSGPFVPTELEWDNEMEPPRLLHAHLLKNEKYWDKENVRLAKVDVTFYGAVGGSAIIYQKYMQGEIDFVPGFRQNDLVGNWQEAQREDFVVKNGPGVYFYFLNNKRAPFDNKNFRKAINLAIDKQTLVEKIASASNRPAYTLIPKIMKGYHSPPVEITYNPEESLRIIHEEFGGPDQVPHFTINVFALTADIPVANFILQNLRDLGLNVTLNSISYNQFLQYFGSAKEYGNFYMHRFAWIPDVLDPIDYLKLFLPNHKYNLSNYENENFRLLIEKSQQADINQYERLDILREAEKLLLEEYAIIPLYYMFNSMLIKPYVKGMYLNERNLHPLKGVYLSN